MYEIKYNPESGKETESTLFDKDGNRLSKLSYDPNSEEVQKLVKYDPETGEPIPTIAQRLVNGLSSGMNTVSNGVTKFGSKAKSVAVNGYKNTVEGISGIMNASKEAVEEKKKEITEFFRSLKKLFNPFETIEQTMSDMEKDWKKNND